MKRAGFVLGAICLIAVIAYLAISKNLAEGRAARLDRALMDAEARMMKLESEIESARHQLADLASAQQASRQSKVTEGGGKPPGAMTQASSGGAAQTTDPASPPAGQTAAAATEPAVTPSSWTRYAALAGGGATNMVKIEGTSTIHDWRVVGYLVGGSAEFGDPFPPAPGSETKSSVLRAKVNAFIPVRSMKSLTADGRPYSDAMDEIMYEKLKAEEHKRITFTLSSLALKESPRGGSTSWSYEAKGMLGVAGATNAITMPVNLSPMDEARIQITGSTKVKMTDFEITPPEPKVPGGAVIKTGDEVTLSFVWGISRRSGQ